MKHTLNHILAVVTALLFTAASLIAAEPSSAKMQRILHAADRNQDSRLSLEEYKTLDVQAVHHGDAHFKAEDTNSDGFITAAELVSGLRRQTWFAILTEGSEAYFSRLD